MNDLISVIIPCKNGANYLKEAIDSVKAQNMNTEIIVVDDGSTDNTVDYAKSCGAIVYSIPHSGPSVARNVGLENKKGQFVMFLDHDDLMQPGSLQKMYDALMQNPDVDCVQAQMQDFISPELTEEEKKTLVVRPEPYRGLFAGIMLFKAAVFDKIGGWRSDLKFGECMDLLFRLDEAGFKTLKLDFVSAKRRLHKSNSGRTMRQQERKDYVAVLRAKLAAKK